MGDIAQGIFGGSKSKSQQTSETGNKAYDTLNPALSGQIGQGTQANDFLSKLLGLKGGTEGANAFNQYRDSSAYKFLQNEGSDAVAQNNAASGLLASGSTARGIADRGTNLANTFQNDYMDRLLGINAQGNQAAGVLSDAGRYSKSQGTANSSEKPGLFGKDGFAAFAGSLLSDRRLKTAIEKLGEFADGLGVYSWQYIWGGRRYVGVMADEVAVKRPWALGPVVEGYASVNYGAL